MHFAINLQLKVSIICIGIVKWHFLCNKKKMLEWHLLRNRGSKQFLLQGLQKNMEYSIFTFRINMKFQNKVWSLIFALDIKRLNLKNVITGDNIWGNFAYNTLVIPLFMFTTNKETFSKIHFSLDGKKLLYTYS